MHYYYLWHGIAGIEDLDDCTPQHALDALRVYLPDADVTLWRRDGFEAKLVAVRLHTGQMYLFGPAEAVVDPKDLEQLQKEATKE